MMTQQTKLGFGWFISYRTGDIPLICSTGREIVIFPGVGTVCGEPMPAIHLMLATAGKTKTDSDSCGRGWGSNSRSLLLYPTLNSLKSYCRKTVQRKCHHTYIRWTLVKIGSSLVFVLLYVLGDVRG